MTHDRYTQSSLQDFTECTYRYHLRYNLRLNCPSVQAEPIHDYEQHVTSGVQFHRMAQQVIEGVDPAECIEHVQDQTLEVWWAQFAATGLSSLPERRFAEITLVADLNGNRLVARLDVLAFAPGRVVIVDWKTTRKPGTSQLEDRLQTRVYRWVAASAAEPLTGFAVKPDQIEMRYWFAGAIEPWVVLPYSQAAFERDTYDLLALIERVAGTTVFERTDDLRRCTFCEYRAVCRPDHPPARADQVSEDSSSDWSDIPEIEF